MCPCSAVKALIAKHGLDIDPSLTKEEAEEVEDLGVGTPFEILSTKLEAGKTLWRIVKRSPVGSTASTFHPGTSTTSLSSGSQFEDQDGNPLQGGDVLGAVLSTHPCFPSIGGTRDSDANEHALPHHTSNSEWYSRTISPFGPSVDFHPFTAQQWSWIRGERASSADNDDGMAGGSSNSGSIFDLLQSAELGADESNATIGPEGGDHGPTLRRTSRSSNPSSSPSRKRRKIADYRDDPRVVIWGSPADGNLRSVLQASGPGSCRSLPPSNGPDSSKASASPSSYRADASTPALHSMPLSGVQLEPFPPLRGYQHAAIFPENSAALLAASLERVIVQLTSVIQSRIHIDFFYTFRTFTTPAQLLDLLIERFNWTLQEASSPGDKQVRSVVCVRTYVVLKFWLTHFFEEDFLKDRALRSRLTVWLNGFGGLTQQGSAEAGVISSLRKLVIRFKQFYMSSGVSGLLGQNKEPNDRSDHAATDVSTSTSSSSLAGSSVDLDFPAETSPVEAKRIRDAFGSPSASPSRTKQDAGPAHVRSSSSSSQTSGIGTLSRALNSTVSRLQKVGRNAPKRPDGSTGYAAATSEPSSSDAEDLLFGRAGLDNLIGLFNASSPAGSESASTSASIASGDPQAPSLGSDSVPAQSTPASSIDLPRRSQESSRQDWMESGDDAQLDELVLDQKQVMQTKLGADNLHHTTSEQTLRSPSRRPGAHSRGSSASLRSDKGLTADTEATTTPGVVQIDDIDLSSDEDDDAVRKALRRLPGARDLRMARRAFGSIQSKALSLVLEPKRNTFSSVQCDAEESILDFPRVGGHLGYLTTELFDPDEALAGYELVKGFNLEGFESDEDDPGDAEGALRKLEGYIDEGKKKDRARKVEELWLKSKTNTSDEQGADLLESAIADRHSYEAQSTRASGLKQATLGKQTTKSVQVGGPSAAEARRKPRHESASVATKASRPRPEAPFADPSSTHFSPAHRSFLLNHRSDEVASQMCLIEAELYTHIGWQELASGQWRTFRQRSEVSDWEDFYRLRMREKATAEQAGAGWHENHLGVIVARFNLVANWVASEVVLTQDIAQRAAVIAKFIRIAWVSDTKIAKGPLG